MRWWWWAAIAAVVAAAAWWTRQAKLAADGKLNTTGAPAGAGWSGQLAALLAAGKPAASPVIQLAACKNRNKSGGCADRLSERILPAVVPTPIGYGTVAPLSMMNTAAATPPPPASTPPPPKKKLPPGSKCPAGQTPMAFKSGSQSWVECKSTKA